MTEKLKNNSVFEYTFTFEHDLGSSPTFELDIREEQDGNEKLIGIDPYTVDNVFGNQVRIKLTASQTKKLVRPRIFIALLANKGESQEWQGAYFTPSKDPFGEYTLKLESVVGSFTQAELTAALDTRFSDHGVYLKDYGLVGDGVANDTVKMAEALAYAETNKRPVICHPSANYLFDSVLVDSGTVPVFIDMQGATFKSSGANTPANGTVLYVENPHGIHNSAFRIENGVIDCANNNNHGLKIHGSQDCIYRDLSVKNASIDGIVVEGDSGFGVYGCEFSRIDSKYNAGAGINIYSAVSSYQVANNLFSLVECLYNTGNGWRVDYASGTYVACRAERNDGVGISLDHTVNFTWVGGYCENNHKNMANGSDDSSPDEMATLTADSTGVVIFAPRDIGTIEDSAAASNNNVIITRNSASMKLNASGDMDVNSVRVGSAGGLAFGTAAMPSGGIGAITGFSIYASGKNNQRYNNTTSADDSYTEIRFNLGGSDVFRNISAGAADSGVSGKRMLMVDN